MRVVISGGSNSVRKHGWTAALAAKVPAGTEIVNLSVGASTSTMGAWRVMTAGNLQQGDTLIWEYAVNDRNHIAKSSIRPGTLLRHVEQELAGAAEAGVRVLAVILVSLRQAAKGDDGYLTALRALFARYGAPVFDASQPMPGGNLRRVDFDDPNHVAVGGRVMNALVDWVVARLADPAPAVVAVPGGTARRLITLDGPGLAQAERFRNGLLDLSVARIPEGPGGFDVVNRGGRPVELQGFVILAHRESGVLSISAGGQRHFVTSAIPLEEKKPELLRYLSLEAVAGVRPVVPPGGDVRLTWATPRSAALAMRLPSGVGRGLLRVMSYLPGGAGVGHDVGFARMPSARNRDARGSRIAAVLAETL